MRTSIIKYSCILLNGIPKTVRLTKIGIDTETKVISVDKPMHRVRHHE